MATRNIVPRATGEGGIGTAAKKWALGWINALIVATINALVLTAQAIGFTISGGTTSKALTVTADTSLDEAVAMSSKAPKTDTIKGDGTAGRVFRSVYFLITDGTNANTLKVQRISRSGWIGDAEAAQDNIAKGATTGNYSLDANGWTLTWLNSGMTGDAVAVFAGELYINEVTVAHTVNVDKTASGVALVFYTAAGGTVADITSIIDTGTGGLSLNIVYVTSE